ncbi:MAG: hypothetical protein JXJ17_02675 [Anaerolineae bacterium]|nr:hypothetical protein [Anaerolineae bacterium]
MSDSEPVSFSIIPIRPLFHGGDQAGEYVEPVIAPVDREAANKPITPGMPLLMHIPLPPPDAWKVPVPQGSVEQPIQTNRQLLIGQRVAFPVAPSPGIQPISTGVPASPPPIESTSVIEPPAEPVRVVAEPPAAETPAQRFDPVYPYLLYLALGFGTLYINLDAVTRYTILWMVLMILGGVLGLLDSTEQPQEITPAGLGWGFSIGLVFSLPLLILVGSGLSNLSTALFPEAGAALLFQSLAVVGPMGETLFFRGAILDRRGFAASVIAAGLSSLLFFWPVAVTAWTYLIAAVLFSTVLAGIYSFVRTRYGLAASYICQVTINLMLLFVPGVWFT